MKFLLIASLALSLNALAQQQGGKSASESLQGSGHSPGGSSNGQGSYTTPHAGLGDNAPTNATTRGTDISGAGTMGTQEYPNSGSTNNQSSDVTGNSAGSGVPLPGDKKSSMTKKRNGEKSFDETLDQGSTQTGPYNNSDEMQAQQAKSGREIEPDSQQEKKRKQQGE